MANNLADITAWRDALEKARLRGVRSVRDASGEQVEFKSDAEMAAAIAAADRAIATRQPIHTIRFTTSKGL